MSMIDDNENVGFMIIPWLEELAREIRMRFGDAISRERPNIDPRAMI